jgi:hypothetical protein
MLIYLKILIKIKFLVEICKPGGRMAPPSPPWLRHYHEPQQPEHQFVSYNELQAIELQIFLN